MAAPWRPTSRNSAFFALVLAVMISSILAGCGGNGGGSGSGGNNGGNGGSGSGGGNGGSNCSLGLNPGFCGTLTGLPSGKTVTLNFSTSDAGSGDLTLNANGSFVFQLGTQVDNSTTWNISVSTESSGTSCNVTNQGSNGSGGVRTQQITGVTVTCSAATTYTISGTLSGLNTGAQITLENNGSNGTDTLTLTANGVFTFSNPVNQGGAYNVSVGTQPTDQLCTVSQGAGSNVTANVTSVVVTCTNAFPVGGTLTGLNSGAEVTLKDNGGDSLGIMANGTFTFPTPVLQGNTYDVTVSIQPTNQFCSVTGGSGTVSGVVTSVQVACITIEQVLYTFTGGTSDGANPHSGLVMDSGGNFYGTTASGGNNHCNSSGCGTVFKLAPNGSGGYTESVLYAFLGGTDGTTPEAGLILDSLGNLYGTTEGGGSNDLGTVFKLAPNGSGGYLESVLYSITGSDEGVPQSVLLMDSAGNLYGTTAAYYYGNSSGNGAVFKLAPNGSGGYTESVLYAFTGGNDGASSTAGLITDSAGNFYGTTTSGGINNCSDGCGAVFKLAPNGSGGYTESTLHTFSGGSDGGTPEGGLVMDTAGDLYGTAAGGGSDNSGTVFELTPNGSGGYTVSILHTFIGGLTGPDGAGPAASLLMDKAGDLYGTTSGGGDVGDGTVFKLAPNGGGYTESVLHSFDSAYEGAGPQAGLILDSAGRLYGTTVNGGGDVVCNNGCGIVFEVTPY